jgi:hypothetical protein
VNVLASRLRRLEPGNRPGRPLTKDFCCSVDPGLLKVRLSPGSDLAFDLEPQSTRAAASHL